MNPLQGGELAEEMAQVPDALGSTLLMVTRCTGYEGDFAFVRIGLTLSSCGGNTLL